MSKIDDVRNMLITLLAGRDQLTTDYIAQQVYAISGVWGDEIADDEKKDLIKYLESQFDISMNMGAVVQEEFHRWLDAAKSDIEPYFWERYKWLLEQKGFGLKVVPVLDRVTDELLGLLENPKKTGAWERKGLVVGHVQSGKTANYTGLVCKAADAGYRLIIVIAGVHNNLRSQTQARIDEGFVGRDSARLFQQGPGHSRYIGVGRRDHRRKPITITNTNDDFKKKTAEALGLQLTAVNEPVVLVIKKNPSTLRNLIEWLKEHNADADKKIDNYPMLLIDDEADNASINTSSNPDESTTINRLLREVLALFHKRCYIGYTATPFANIFIDPSTDEEMLGGDLFPKDFIKSLEAPSNYIGSEKVFGDAGSLDIVRYIEDYQDIFPIKHKIDFCVDTLPESLEKAVLVFILSISVRILRGMTNSHNSMLVNISRFTNVQSQVRNLIHSFVDSVQKRIRYNYNLPSEKALRDPVMKELSENYAEEFRDVEFPWEKIQEVLKKAASSVRTIEINSRSPEKLDYTAYSETGLNVVAVGGFSLSRGLTLEGLTVSYFLRNSIMYDTLLQMGRWFGYRPGYEDLCRVYMPEEAASWYSHISGVIEELRLELIEMDHRNLTPKDFGLKVRSHPDSLIVTARNKMRSGEKVRRSITLAERLIETDKIFKDSRIIKENREVFQSLAEQLISGGFQYSMSRKNNYLWENVSVSLIKNFIGKFNNHPVSMRTDTDLVLEYIRTREADELDTWDVVLVNKDKASAEQTEKLAGTLLVGMQDRYAGFNSFRDADYFAIGGRRRVGSMGIESEGLSDEAVIEAEKRFYEDKPEGKNVSDIYYRKQREKPLLMLHLLHLFGKKKDRESTVASGVPVYGISFPRTARETELVEYVVNTTYWNESFGYDLEGDEDE